MALKIFNKILRVFLWMLMGVLSLVPLACVVVYIPAVQKLAIDKASAAVARGTGYALTVERFRLRFPLGVSARGATVVTPAGDTLAEVGRLRVHAALFPLLKGRVRVSEIGLEDARAGYRDTVSGMTLRVRIDAMNVGVVALDPAEKSVRLTRAAIDGGDVALFTGRGTADSLAPPADSLTFDWNIDAGRLELSGLAFALDMPADSVSAPASAFDHRRIRADGVGVSVRDAAFRAGDISVSFEGLQFSERSGLRVTGGGGDFTMNSDYISLTGFALETSGSRIEGSARAGAGIMDADPATPVSVQLSAALSPREIALFAPLPAQLEPVLSGKKVTLKGTVDGALDNLTLEGITAALAPNISLKAHGVLRSVTAPQRLSGSVTLDGELADLDFARDFVADTALARRIAVPRGMTIRAAAYFSPESYILKELTLRADTGRLDARGRFNPRAESYAADLRLIDFPAGAFLPKDSLGVATLALRARGRGFDPTTLKAVAMLAIDRFDYKNTDFGRVTADLDATEGHITGDIRSRSDLLATNISLNAVVARDTLRTTEAPAPMNYTLAARIDSTVVLFGGGRHRIEPVDVRASASSAGTEATVRSGDMALDVYSPLPLDLLKRSAAGAGNEVMKQLAARHFSPDSLQSAFPQMTMAARAGRGNFLHELVRLQGFDFRTFSADVYNDTGRPFSIDARAVGITSGSLEVDTLSLCAIRNGRMLDYELRLANRTSTVAGTGLICVAGSAGGNALTARVMQQNTDGDVGFDFGLRASFVNNGSIRVEMAQDPVLGYERWRVGSAESPGNWLEYGQGGRLSADLNLDSAGDGADRELTPLEMMMLGSAWSMSSAAAALAPERHFSITTDSLPRLPRGALRLTAHGLDLARMLDLFPAAPPIGGLISSDITFGFHAGEKRSIVVARGSLGAKDFSYNTRRVADIDAAVSFGMGSSGRMLLNASVSLEKNTALTARGSYSAGAIDFNVDIPAVPLSVIEVFMPEGAAELSGNLDGRVRITGTPSKPVLEGDAGFTDGKANVTVIGTTFGISPERIVIAGDRVMFDNFGLIAPNNRRLALNGGVGIADLTTPTADLTIRTRGFQFVNSRHMGGSQVYGTAALDANITARGTLDAIRVRGDIDLSEDTDIVYIMRSGVQKVRDERQNVVQFVSFADSVALAESEAAVPVRRSGVDVLLGVNIGEGLKATLSLDELNENRVELIGGGDLSFSMNSQGDTRMAGRYTLSGGTLYYKPPVIPRKIFAVEDGSYVDWAGAPANPQFHVTATQTMDVRLEYDGGDSRDVDFDITVDVSGSLSGIDMTFDVAAPTDLAIQNELLALSPEAKMQQALTLLLYGQYTGAGVSSKGMAFDARSQLGDFISKEVNQWVRNNLKGVDFSMGIDTRTGDTGGSYTDYSYSVSKTLFSDRVKISIGGRVNDGTGVSEGFADNLLEDVTLEYRLTRRDNMFLKLYRYNTRESILEGEVTETGGGFVIRKKLNRPGDIFRRTRPRMGRGVGRSGSLRINGTGQRPERVESEK